MTALQRPDKNMTDQDGTPAGGFAKLSIQDEDGNDRGIFFHGQDLDINFSAILKPRNVCNQMVQCTKRYIRAPRSTLSIGHRDSSTLL